MWESPIFGHASYRCRLQILKGRARALGGACTNLIFVTRLRLACVRFGYLLSTAGESFKGHWPRICGVLVRATLDATEAWWNWWDMMRSACRRDSCCIEQPLRLSPPTFVIHYDFKSSPDEAHIVRLSDIVPLHRPHYQLEVCLHLFPFSPLLGYSKSSCLWAYRRPTCAWWARFAK